MKILTKFAAALTLVGAIWASPAHASDLQTLKKFCINISDVAYQAAIARDSGIPYSDYVSKEQQEWNGVATARGESQQIRNFWGFMQKVIHTAYQSDMSADEEEGWAYGRCMVLFNESASSSHEADE